MELRNFKRIPAFILNLNDRVDRINRMRDVLRNYPIQWRRIGSEKDEDPILGNRESHLKAIIRGKKVKTDVFLVLEDDVEVHGNFDNVWTALDGLKNTEWDILLLGCNFVLPSRGDEYSEDVVRVDRFTGTHAYVVNKYSVDKLLHLTAMERSPVDWTYSEMGIKIYCMRRFVFRPSVSVSDITAGDLDSYHRNSSDTTEECLRKSI